MTKAFDAVAASRRGVERRRARAELKAKLAAGEYRLVEAFDDAEDPGADPALRGLRVEWFLRSIPGFGITKTHSLLSSLGISPTATLGGLRVRQRSALRAEVQRLYRRYFPHLRGVLIVLVGPSGVGKGTIVSWITSRYDTFVVSISATTRAQRPGERDAEHYFFVSPREFQKLIDSDELLEWAVVHGENLYGTPRRPVEDHLDSGKNVILEIDIQGAKQVKKAMRGSLFIFVAPPTFQDLEERLRARGTEDDMERKRRLATARREMARQQDFDHVVVNVSVEEAGQSIVDLALASQGAKATKE